jgi:hypothetical protein
MGEQGSSTVSKSLQQHGEAEIYKQLRLRMKNSGLDTIKVEVTRRAGKFRFNFTGSAEQVTQAEQLGIQREAAEDELPGGEQSKATAALGAPQTASAILPLQVAAGFDPSPV